MVPSFFPHAEGKVKVCARTAHLDFDEALALGALPKVVTQLLDFAAVFRGTTVFGRASGKPYSAWRGLNEA
jgi:hypothetical protein